MTSKITSDRTPGSAPQASSTAAARPSSAGKVMVRQPADVMAPQVLASIGGAAAYAPDSRALDRPGITARMINQSIGIAAGMLRGDMAPNREAPVAYHFAEVLLRSGRVEEATRQYHRALRAAPHVAAINLGLGHAMYWSAPGFAAQYAEMAVACADTSPRAWALQALACSEDPNTLGDAFNHLQTALALEEAASDGSGFRDAMCTVAQAVVLRRLGRDAQALAVLEDDLAAGRTNYLLLAVTADAHLAAGRIEDARSLVEQVLEAMPMHAPATIVRARIEAHDGDFARAGATMAAVICQEPWMLPAWRAQAEIAGAAGAPETQRTALAAVLRLSPADTAAREAYMDLSLSARDAAAVLAEHPKLPPEHQATPHARERLALATVLAEGVAGRREFHPGLAAWDAARRPATDAPANMPAIDVAGEALRADATAEELARRVHNMSTTVGSIELLHALDDRILHFPQDTRFLVLRGEVHRRNAFFSEAEHDHRAALAIDPQCSAAKQGLRDVMQSRRSRAYENFCTVMNAAGSTAKQLASGTRTVIAGGREVLRVVGWAP